MGQHIVEVEGLSKSFASFEAVKHISFHIEKGSVYGFLGQNGAGKSTTMRMLLSLIQPSSGKIKIFGKPLKGNEKHILSNIGAIIEKPDTYGYLSGYDNLKIFSKIYGRPTSLSALDALLEKVGILESAWSNKLVTQNEMRFEMPREEIPLLVKFLVDQQISVSNVQSNHSLENYFLKLTNA